MVVIGKHKKILTGLIFVVLSLCLVFNVEKFNKYFINILEFKSTYKSGYSVNNLTSNQHNHAEYKRHGVNPVIYHGKTTFYATTLQPKSGTKRSMIKTRVNNNDISCKTLIEGDKGEIRRAYEKMKKEKRYNITEDLYVERTKNCTNFLQKRGYILKPLSKTEENFEIAYSIVMYKDTFQAERLLRAIYRPQNVYCIHVDKKAHEKIKLAMKNICKCFNNVFLSSRTVDVYWGKFSLLEADLICMKELWQTKKKWKYFINLTGHEFPLKTNFELTQILSSYGGANDVEGSVERKFHFRWANARPVPHGLRPVKGNVHVAINRKFVDYILHNQTARELLSWLKNTYIPDELFFSTLHYNPQLGIKGTYLGEPTNETHNNHQYLARYIIWTHRKREKLCKGKWRNYLCIFGIENLSLLTRRPELFVNKLFWDYQYFTLDCLEEWHRNKTNKEYLDKHPSVNTSFYEHKDFVRNKVK